MRQVGVCKGGRGFQGLLLKPANDGEWRVQYFCVRWIWIWKEKLLKPGLGNSPFHRVRGWMFIHPTDGGHKKPCPPSYLKLIRVSCPADVASRGSTVINGNDHLAPVRLLHPMENSRTRRTQHQIGGEPLRMGADACFLSS